MQINLVTGYTGEAHIKSEDDALLNSFLAGQDNAVINLESEFNDTDCDISCDALVNGRLTRTDEAVNLTFTKPSSGYYRYDGIYIVYKKATSGIESAELVYCEGTENASQEGAEQNIGQPTTGADVVASSVLQLYVVAWDNAQSKTESAAVSVEGVVSSAQYTRATLPSLPPQFSSLQIRAVKKGGWAFVEAGFLTDSAVVADNWTSGMNFTITDLNLPRPLIVPSQTITYPRSGANMPLAFMTAKILDTGDLFVVNNDITTTLSHGTVGTFNFAYPCER